MDINVDQGLPRNDMIKGDTGAYIYKDPTNNKFDIDKFNLEFDQYRARRKAEMEQKKEQVLNELNKPKEVIPIYNEPLGQVLVRTKDVMFGTLDDLLQRKFEMKTLTKDNRLFYIGLLLLIIGSVVFLYHMLLGNIGRTKAGYGTSVGDDGVIKIRIVKE